MLTLVVFVAVFAIAAMLLLTMTASAEEKKQAATRLEAVTHATALKEAIVDVRKREISSSIPLLNRILTEAEITPKLRTLLSQAGVPWTPSKLLLTCAACFVFPAYLIYLRTGVVVASIAAGAIFGFGPLAYVFQKRNQRFDRFEQGLPGALELMVSGLRSGHSLVSAMSLVAREAPDPLGREFRICFDEQNYGLELRTAMSNLAERVPIQDVRMITTAILIQKETGGNLAEVLERCAHLIRERFRLKKEIRIRTAQGRLTGWILSFLPVILGLILFLVNPKHISLLWSRPLGVKMMYASSVMTLAGGLVIRKIVRIRV